MALQIDKAVTQLFDQAIKLEWLETNGLGGYSSSTIIGTNTRRYHGLLVAATAPPVGRINLLAKMDEKIHFNGTQVELGCNQYGGAIHPNGYIFLQQFKKDLFPEFIYKINGIRLKKTIAAIHGENTVVICYEVLSANHDFCLELNPMIAARDFHALTYSNSSLQYHSTFSDGILQVQPYPEIPSLFISVPHAEFHADSKWYYNLFYQNEHFRGLDNHEDLFSYGQFKVDLKEGQRLFVIASTASPKERDGQALFEGEKKRRQNLLSSFEDYPQFVKNLVLSADQFIVERGEEQKSIIAGYHWFSDWGRDTMIALPGLCLETKRIAEARQILQTFAAHIDQGMIPNRFPDSGEEPVYNTIDATLWFFIACYQYVKKTNDEKFLKEICPALNEIIDWHIKGTRFGIKMDKDGLLKGGEAGQQLTWMDAKAGDWVVTPRIGKAVEINALWYNALKILSSFHRRIGNKAKSSTFDALATNTKVSFNKVFWNDEAGCLYDFIDQAHKNNLIRPNQIFALSLPFPLLGESKANQVLDIVENHLFTPLGLRSLSPMHDEYEPYYGGDQYKRDGAYHQGTSWSWLIGPYIDALIRYRGHIGKLQAQEIVLHYVEHFQDAGIGSISEIFDGDSPYIPKGCIAQAWGVGELLRVCLQYKLLSPVKLNSSLEKMSLGRILASYGIL